MKPRLPDLRRRLPARLSRVARKPSGSGRNPRFARALRVTLYGMLAIVIVATIGAAYYVTGQPRTCRQCHELVPAVASHARSLHAQIGCYECHAGGSLAAQSGARLGLLRDLYAHLAKSYEKPLNADGALAARIPDETCERCHSAKREASPRRGVVIDHAIHKKNGVPCTRCHNRSAHLLDVTAQYLIREKIANSVPYRDRTKMAACMECHVGGAGNPPNRCDACHPQQFRLPYNCGSCHTEGLEQLKPQSHFAPDYAKSVHESLAKARTTYCYECHMKSFCDECHAKEKVAVKLPAQTKPQFHKPRSHYEPDFLPPRHGDEAKSQGREVCYQCHTEKFCADCHGGLEMPHPEAFFPQHGATMRKLGYANSCVRCHPNRNNFCESGCHHRGWNPALGPLDRSHPQVVKANGGVGYCLGCHTSVFCAVCHVSGRKTRMFRE